MEFEEVEMEEDYLIEGDISDASPVKTSHEPAPKVARLVPKSEPSTSGRKIPIIRSAGAVVTPVRTAIRKPVQASASSKISSANKQKKLKRPENNAHDPLVSTLFEQLNSRMAVIEEQLDDILDDLVRRDEDIANIRNNMAETERYMMKKIRALNRKSQRKLQPQRLNLVTFPIPDQEYLEWLEASLDVEEDLQLDLIALFYMAPQVSAKKFFGRNLQNLFGNTSRYAWTERRSFKSYSTLNSTPASTLKTIRLLLKCAWDIFESTSADELEKACRRALNNFNDVQTRQQKPTYFNKLEQL
ncbi:uncharacterized protein LOC129745632 isoform X6 [Uranotaenia lowii]|uniref:uncharacterized protein LOC129745632 isoform X6 n=1 Tax=Uranotaenia lowii TaxID=190385 RepID=UPI00247ABC8F|nr:uncharacterized protein LOC129745632 isoform X6 [Uranotaenia lowii]